MQIRGRDETCQMSEKSFFFTRKSTRAMNGSLSLVSSAARQLLRRPSGSNGTSTRSCSPSPSPPSSRAREIARSSVSYAKSSNGAASETSSRRSRRRRPPPPPRRRRRGTPSRTPRAPPARTPRPRRPPAAGTRPRRARAPRLGGCVVVRVVRVDASRRARVEFDDLSSPPSLLSPRVGFARGAGFEPRPEGRMRRVRMRRCHVSPPHERVHHRVRARRGVGQRASYASKSAFADFETARRRRRRRSSPRRRRRCLKCSRSSLRHPRRHYSRHSRGPREPSRPSRPSKPPSDREKYTKRESRARAARRALKKEVRSRIRRKTHHPRPTKTAKTRRKSPSRRTIRSGTRARGGPSGRPCARRRGTRARAGRGGRGRTPAFGGSGGRSRVSARLVRRRRRTFGKRAEKPGRRVGCRGHPGRPGLGAYLRAFRVLRARARAGEREREARREQQATDRHLVRCAAACGADRRPPGMTRHVSSQGFFRVWNLESFQSRERNEQPKTSNRRKRGSNNQGSIRTT